jgi:hypothetical protein
MIYKMVNENVSISLNHPLEQKHKIIDVPFGVNIGRMVSDKNIEN